MTAKTIAYTILMTALWAMAMDGRNVSKQQQLDSPREKSIEILRLASKSKDPIIRMDAIESIAICRCKPLYVVIDKTLSDPVNGVRFAAALAAGDIGYEDAAGKLDKLFEQTDDLNEKIAAAYALLRLGDNKDKYHKAIVAAIQSKRATTNANAALIMGKLKSPRYIGLLKWLLQNQNTAPKAQIQAIEALAMLGYEDINSKAWALMISKRADDRVMGILTMYHLGNYDAKNAIKTMLDDSVLEVRLVAAGRLEALGDDAGVEIIRNFFEQELDKLSGEDRSRALVHALDAVRMSGNLELAEILPEFLDDENISVRIHTALAVLSL